MAEREPVSLDALNGLLKERQRYEEWLAALEEKRANTSDAVFQRVRGDYQTRLREVSGKLAERAGELRETIDSLTVRLDEISRQELQQREARQEAELRAAVGEYTDKQWKEIGGAWDKEISRLSKEKAALDTQLTELNRIFALSMKEKQAEAIAHGRPGGEDGVARTPISPVIPRPAIPEPPTLNPPWRALSRQLRVRRRPGRRSINFPCCVRAALPERHRRARRSRLRPLSPRVGAPRIPDPSSTRLSSVRSAAPPTIRRSGTANAVAESWRRCKKGAVRRLVCFARAPCGAFFFTSQPSRAGSCDVQRRCDGSSPSGRRDPEAARQRASLQRSLRTPASTRCEAPTSGRGCGWRRRVTSACAFSLKQDLALADLRSVCWCGVAVKFACCNGLRQVEQRAKTRVSGQFLLVGCRRELSQVRPTNLHSLVPGRRAQC